MPAQLTLSFKVVGKKKNQFEYLTQPLSDEQLTLRALITQVIEEQVKQYNAQVSEPEALRFLTTQQIEESASTGKIQTEKKDRTEVSLEEATQTALQAFLDGLYKVFIGESEVTTLEHVISIQDNTPVMFLKLTLLTGGYTW
jgi:hypothetical protein